MNVSQSSGAQCPHCGAEISLGAQGAMCPRCALRAALAASDNEYGSQFLSLHDIPKPGQTISCIGDYELIDVIARGGMGVVYRARQRSLNRVVALKMMLGGGHANNDFKSRFLREAKTVAKLQHPNIVPIYEVGEHEGQPYFSMEYVPGETLAQKIRDRMLPAREAVNYVKTVAEAVRYAHEQGILHRDLKPSNILLDANDRPRVTDFGLARQMDADPGLTLSGQPLGTPGYLPPEQVAAKRGTMGPWSDVYSLGALLYHLLTGRPPFLAGTLADTLDQVKNVEPVSPRSVNPAVAKDLETLCLKCLEKEPQSRYASMGELVDDLGRWLNGEPIQARPTTNFERITKWIKRKPAIAALVAGIVLLLITIAIGAPIVMFRISSARDVARRNAEAQTKAKGEAQVQQKRAEEALAEIQNQRIEELFAADDSVRALAGLASVLTSDPSNRVAAERLLSALTYRSLSLPKVELRHEGTISTAQFSPDGLRVVTAAADKTARVWDAQTGKPLTEPLRHDDTVTSAEFSSDGWRILTTSKDKTARLWDLHTGKPLTEPLRHEDTITISKFSPDGRRMVTACRNWRAQTSVARVWDAQNGKLLTESIRHQGTIGAEFSPDGQRLVTASADKTARVWDAQTGMPLTEPLRHEGIVSTAQFSPDGRWVVTASTDKTARIWDAQTGTLLTDPIRHDGHVVSAQFSPDGLRVVSAGGSTVRIWDAQSGTQLTDPLHHKDGIRSAWFSSDGLWVFTLSRNTALVWDAQSGKLISETLLHVVSNRVGRISPLGNQELKVSGNTAQIWDIQSGKPLAEQFRHELGLVSARFSPDGVRLVTASQDNSARVWDVQRSGPLGEPLWHDAGVGAAEFSPDGLRVVTASWDGTARVWDARTGNPLTEPLWHQRPDFVGSIPDGDFFVAKFSPDGRRVLTGTIGNTVRVWDVQTGKPLIETLQLEQPIAVAEFSPDGLRVVTASGNAARVSDVQAGKATEILRHESPVFTAPPRQDGARVVKGLRVLTASREATVPVKVPQTGKLLTTLNHEGMVVSARFSPNGLQVVTASKDKTARLWDAQTGKQLTEPLRHEGPVRLAQFSPDGFRIVTTSYENTARLWDAHTGKPLTEPLRYESAILSAQFNRTGLRVVTASRTAVRVWDGQTGKPLTELLPHGLVASARLSPDGLRLVTASGDNTARLWDLPSDPAPVPSWLAHLAVAVGGKRLTGTTFLEPVGEEEFLKLKEQLMNSNATDFYTRWAQWFCADRTTRTISPFSRFTVPEYVQRRIDENTVQSLQEAVRLSPGNADALARLGFEIIAQDPKLYPRQIAEAQFLGRRALKLAPENPTVLALTKRIEAKVKSAQKGR